MIESSQLQGGTTKLDLSIVDQADFRNTRHGFETAMDPSQKRADKVNIKDRADALNA
jgi:hypothetical protein